MAVGGKASAEALIGNNAVLSFVTGRLDRLNPEGIPSIIADSPFLRQAISAGEISDLMQQKFSVSDLCRLFEVDQKVINKAAINGLNTGLLVTPKEFLSAIGVDPGTVATELTLLQQNLPVDGVKPYIERA